MSRGQIFISYSRTDEASMVRIRDQLQALGFETLTDTNDLLAGEVWRQQIEYMIATASAVLFLVSPRSLASDTCLWELSLAKRDEKRIVPAALEPIDGAPLPDEIASIQCAELCGDVDFEAGINHLAQAFDRNIDWLNEHTRLAGLASRWDAGQGGLLSGFELRLALNWIGNQPPTAPTPPAHVVDLIRQSRRARQGRWFGVALVLIAIAIGAISFLQWQENTRRAAEMREAAQELRAARELIRVDLQERSLTSRQLYNSGRYAEAIVWGLWSWPQDPDHVDLAHSAALDNIRNAMQRQRAVVVLDIENVEDGELRTNSVAFSPSGDRIVTGSDDYSARIWDARTGVALFTLFPHAAPVQSAHFSRDGDTVVTVSGRQVTLWDARTGRRHDQVLSHSVNILSAGFGADSQSIIAHDHEGGVHLWTHDAPEGQEEEQEGYDWQEILLESETPIAMIDVSPTGDLFLSVTDGDLLVQSLENVVAGPAQVVEIVQDPGPPEHEPADANESDRPVMPDPAPGIMAFAREGNIRIAVFDASGSRVAVVSEDLNYQVVVRSVPDGQTGDQTEDQTDEQTGEQTDEQTDEQTWVLEPSSLDPRIKVTGVAFSPEGGRIATLTERGTLRIWDIEDQRMLFERRTNSPSTNDLPAPERDFRTFTDIAFSPDGRFVATSERNGAVEIWDVLRGVPMSAAQVRSAPLWSTGPMLDHIALSQDMTVIDDNTAEIDFGAHRAQIIAGRVVVIVDAESGAPMHPTPLVHVTSVTSVAVSPDGLRVLSGAQDGTVWLWDIETGRVIMRLRGRGAPVRAVIWSGDGKYARVETADGRSRIWSLDLPEGNLLQVACQLLPYTNGVRNLTLPNVVHGKIDTGGGNSGSAPQPRLTPCDRFDPPMLPVLQTAPLSGPGGETRDP